MLRLRLIHWNAAAASRYRALLAKADHSIEYSPEFSPQLMREWRASPPDAFVIDLSRLPSHGREIATALRQSKATRSVPILFCEGESEKVAKARKFLPDAIFCSFANLRSALRTAVRATPRDPVIPLPMMDRYGGRSTAQKLGIRAGGTLCLLDPPRDMPAALGPLPEDASLVEETAAVTLFFATDPEQLRRRLAGLRSLAAKTKLWVCWKKGKAAAETGVNETLVRETGLAFGLVDYKVCSVNQIWSGVLFARQK